MGGVGTIFALTGPGAGGGRGLSTTPDPIIKETGDSWADIAISIGVLSKNWGTRTVTILLADGSHPMTDTDFELIGQHNGRLQIIAQNVTSSAGSSQNAIIPFSGDGAFQILNTSLMIDIVSVKLILAAQNNLVPFNIDGNPVITTSRCCFDFANADAEASVFFLGGGRVSSYQDCFIGSDSQVTNYVKFARGGAESQGGIVQVFEPIFETTTFTNAGNGKGGVVMDPASTAFGNNTANGAIELGGSSVSNDIIPIIAGYTEEVDGIQLSIDTTNFGLKGNLTVCVTGSSTAVGFGVNAEDSFASIIESMITSIVNNPTFSNIAISSTTTYELLPTGTDTPVDRPDPNILMNVTAAIATGADIILIASPSNDAVNSYTTAEIVNNWNIIIKAITDAGKLPIFIGSNPRTSTTEVKTVLYEVERNLKQLYPDLICPTYEYTVDSIGEMRADYDSGDGTHYNRNGHLVIAGNMLDKVMPAIEYNSFKEIIIERSDSAGGPFTVVGRVFNGLGLFLDTSVVDGGTYYYRSKFVLASNKGSNYSSTIQAVFADSNAPIISFSPVDGAIGVSVDADIIISADEAIRNTDGTEITDANVASLIIFKDVALGTDISFTATINAGKDTITISPAAPLEDQKQYFVALIPVEDNSGNETGLESTTFTTAVGLPVAGNILVNFSASIITGGDYNDAIGEPYDDGAAPYSNIALSSLTAVGGDVLAIGLETLNDSDYQWGWETTSNGSNDDDGTETGNDSGVFPDNVLVSYWFCNEDSSPSGAKLKLTGLDDGTLYAIRLTGSRTGVTRNTEYTIGGTTQSVAVGSNTSQDTTFSNLTPVGGEIEILVKPEAGDLFGYLNGLELSW